MKFCVIGLGRFGYNLALSLAEQHNEVLAIDKNESIVSSIKDYVTQAICAEIKDEESMLALGVEGVETVIIAIGEDFAQSTLLTALLKKIIKAPRVIARAVNDIHATVLTLVGADRVISLEKSMAVKLAQQLSMPLGELVQITGDFATAQVTMETRFIGRKVGDLIRSQNGKIICIAVKKGNLVNLIDHSYVIASEDTLIFAGQRQALGWLVHM